MSSGKGNREETKAVKRAVSKICSHAKAPINLKLSVMGMATSSCFNSNGNALQRLGFCDESVPKGTHICMFYADAPERDEIMFEFLRAGILDEERCYFVLHDQRPLNWIKQGHERGIDLEPALDRDQVTVLNTDQFYLPGGSFCADDVVSNLHSATEMAMLNRYPSFRAFGEVSWVSGRKDDQEPVIEYEQKLDQQYFNNSPSVIMCVYDIKAFGDVFLDDILTTHPYYIYKGSFKTNPCYSPTDHAV